MTDPSQWRTRAEGNASHINPTYPRDGRETISPPHEAVQPTTTAGAFLEAQRRVRERDPLLPHDYDAYLAQRVPSSHKMSEIPSGTEIDRYGRAINAES